MMSWVVSDLTISNIMAVFLSKDTFLDLLYQSTDKRYQWLLFFSKDHATMNDKTILLTERH